MGRFNSTAAAYAKHREPYPPAFFAEAAKALKLTGQEALIDLGTGPGLLALGFVPYVGHILGVDPEPAMVAEAHEAAAAAGVLFPVVLGRAEQIDDSLGQFDLVTIGRALHWMEREPTLAAFDRMLAPGGRIFTTNARSSAANPWRAAFEQVTVAWSSGGEAGNHRAQQNFFEGTRFAAIGDVEAEHQQPVDVEALVARALTRSTTSPAFLGERLEAFKTDLRAALAPFFAEGPGDEIIVAKGRIFAAA